MAKYSFLCSSCGKSIQRYVPTSVKIQKCECGAEMNRKMPKIGGTQVNELHDKYSNKSLVQNHKEIINERKVDYYWAVEVPKMVDSGTYELDTMLEKEWVYYDEKHNLVTRTKPPQKS